MERHRRLVVVRGDTEVPPLVGEGVWVGPSGMPAAEVRSLLGKSFDFVVLDARSGLDADVLGQVHGFIRGGGVLVLRLWAGETPPAEGLAVWPYGPEAVGRRFGARVDACVGAFQPSSAASDAPSHAEQAAVVDRLVTVLAGPPSGRVVLLSDRGRGKSSALGLALRRLEGASVVVTAGQVDSIAEVERFAPGPVRYLTPAEIAFGSDNFDVILVDEAAQIPVPLLQRIVRRHPQARMAFATTARGYEGTGRGFVLRFLEWLRSEGPVVDLTLTEPIRWGPGDPLERWVFDLLLLDAEPAALTGVDPAAIEAVVLDRGALAENEAQLREFFGLLVHAHYRTTPGDLHRLLDAPNVRLHALLHRGQVVAASLVALEGGLTAATCADLAAGRMRLRGHALAETLVVHAGEVEAGTLSMVRSVRIAVHPALRRLGLGQRLVDHVHATYQPDLFGTLFGATPELLRFRREVGYALVRVGASRGSRTGEPAAVMVRPVSPRAHTLFHRLRGALARDLPAQLAWMAHGDLVIEPELDAALRTQLPDPTPLSDGECAQIARAYAFGPRTLESVLVPLRRFLEQADLRSLSAEEQRLLAAVRGGLGWEAAAGALSLPAAMRAVRRAVRSLLYSRSP